MMDDTLLTRLIEDSYAHFDVYQTFGEQSFAMKVALIAFTKSQFTVS